MKKIILKTVLCLSVLFLSVACSNESENAIDMNSKATEEAITTKAAKESTWAGELGRDRGNGNYEITADQDELKKDLEAVLAEQGKYVTLTSIIIEKLYADNDPTMYGYMLKAIDGKGTSIGTPLAKSGDIFRSNFGIYPTQGTTTTCTGCTDGCFLRYLNVDGHSYPYCQEGVCGVLCIKTQN